MDCNFNAINDLNFYHHFTYNASETIIESLESVHIQNHDIEHLIIDGESTDDTLLIIEKYRSNIIKVIYEPGNGVFDAMSKGIKLASGEIVGIYMTMISILVQMFWQKFWRYFLIRMWIHAMAI